MPEKTVKKSKWKVVADPSKCCVCMMCQLVCSLNKENMFNPSKARINISRAIKPDGSLDVGVSFKDECDSCGVCVKYCVYGALSRVKTEEPPAES